MNPGNRFWGLFHRRECLVPTWRGLLLFTLIGVVLVIIAASKVYSFLAVTESLSAEALVVEGWVPDFVLEEAIVIFKRDRYRRLYVTGGPLDHGGPLSEYKTYAELGAATLVRMGMNKSAIKAVPAPSVWRDRTYSSALALKEWLLQHAANEASINLVTVGAHAKRSQLLFQKALGKDSRVGIIAIEGREYDPKRWWRSGNGARTVVGELGAYTYALLFFSPSSEP